MRPPLTPQSTWYRYSTTAHLTQMPLFATAPGAWYYNSILTHHTFMNRKCKDMLEDMSILETRCQPKQSTATIQNSTNT